MPLMKTMAHVSSFVMSNFFPKMPQRFTPAAVRLLNMQRKADTSKAQRELGYQPRPLKDTVTATFQWFKEANVV